jgi:hypothetical protein
MDIEKMNIEQSPASILARFRSDRKRLPLHPLEKAILTAVAVHLCFLPWALGTMHAWSQLTSLSLSLVSFTLALIPRTYSGDYLPALPPQAFSPAAQRPDESRRSFSVGGQPSAFRLYPFARLIRFPIFWLGAALLAYIAIQALNPSWVWERNERSWWLRRVNDIPWLPTSIDTPFERFNIWRQFIIYASAWLTLCTVWIGFTRRRSLQLLLTVLALNGIVLALVGFLARSYFPTWEWVIWLNSQLKGATSFASFIYKNHAAAYLSLLVGAALGLAAWHHERGLRSMARSTPGMLWLLAAVAMAFGVFFTYSRGATLVLAGYLVLAAATYLLSRLLSSARSTTSPLVWLMLTALLLGAVGFGGSQLNYQQAEQTFTSLFVRQEKDLSVAHRLEAYQASESMLSDHGQRGVGAGGFRYLFPEYIKHYPNSYRNGQLFWEHAHCDWLQLPIEVGIGGTALVLLGSLWSLVALYRRRLWRQPAMLLLAFGCLQTLVQAIFDFPFQNPAILVTWLALLVISIRWVELESA